MGIFVRPSRPLARLAAGAATAGIAYNAGKRHEAHTQSAQQAYGVFRDPQYAPSYYGPPTSPDADDRAFRQMGELETLVQLHDAGALTDSEFSAAKSRLLGL